MNEYLFWNEKTIIDFSDENINSLYNEGYVFTRLDNGVMQQTRSVRIDLNKFELSSENKRILRKNEDLKLTVYSLPLENYHWSIGKLAKDFYTAKFGKGTMSANKVREMLTDVEKSNFNKLFAYTLNASKKRGREKEKGGDKKEMIIGEYVGFCITRQTNKIIHYSYPFYLFPHVSFLNIGMGMMTKAAVWAQKQGKQYIYLGSAQRPTDTYKMQFKGLEWFDGEKWNNNPEELKNIIKS